MRRGARALGVVAALCVAQSAFAQDGSGAAATAAPASAAAVAQEASAPAAPVVVPSEGSAAAAPTVADGSLVQVAVVSIEPTAAPVGTLRSIAVTITPPPGWAITDVSLDERYFVEVVDVIEGVTDVSGVLQRTLSVRSFRPGTHNVPGVTVRGIDDAGRPFTTTSAGFVVEVSAVTANESDPQPAPSEGLISVRVPDRRPLYAAFALVAALLGALGWSLWRRSVRLATPPPPPPPPRPADEVALERLAALENGGYIERGEHLEFHGELSEIARRFFGDVFGFDGVERTTVEIRAELLARGEAAARWETRLLAILADTDMVKFARWAPPEAVSRRLLSETRELVLDVAARTRAAVAPATDGDVVASPAASLPAVPDSQEKP